jgi:hypothetical protein
MPSDNSDGTGETRGRLPRLRKAGGEDVGGCGGIGSLGGAHALERRAAYGGLVPPELGREVDAHVAAGGVDSGALKGVSNGRGSTVNRDGGKARNECARKIFIRAEVVKCGESGVHRLGRA